VRPSWSADATDEAEQSLNFSLEYVSGDSEIFSLVEVDAGSGRLTVCPAPERNGKLTLSLKLSDDGGVSNGGVDTFASANITFVVREMNDPPTFLVPEHTVQLYKTRPSTGVPRS